MKGLFFPTWQTEDVGDTSDVNYTHSFTLRIQPLTPKVQFFFFFSSNIFFSSNHTANYYSSRSYAATPSQGDDVVSMVLGCYSNPVRMMQSNLCI